MFLSTSQLKIIFRFVHESRTLFIKRWRALRSWSWLSLVNCSYVHTQTQREAAAESAKKSNNWRARMRTGVFVLPFCMCLLKNIEVFISVSLIWEMQKKKGSDVVNDMGYVGSIGMSSERKHLEHDVSWWRRSRLWIISLKHRQTRKISRNAFFSENNAKQLDSTLGGCRRWRWVYGESFWREFCGRKVGSHDHINRYCPVGQLFYSIYILSQF